MLQLRNILPYCCRLFPAGLSPVLRRTRFPSVSLSHKDFRSVSLAILCREDPANFQFDVLVPTICTMRVLPHWPCTRQCYHLRRIVLCQNRLFIQWAGSSTLAWARKLLISFPPCRQVYDDAGDILATTVAKLSFEAGEEDISRTIYSQPLIYTHSMAAYYAVQEICPPPQGVAGHSLGEYAALTVGGALSLEDGLRAISARAKAMDRATQSARGAMFAILGSDLETVDRVCQETPGFVLPVNLNSPSQTVIAGEEGPAAQAAATLAAQGPKRSASRCRAPSTQR